MREFGYTEQSSIRRELDIEFLTYFDTYLTSQKQKLAKDTVNTRKSLVEQWQQSWLDMVIQDGLPKEFKDALREIIKASGLSVFMFAKRCGVSHNTMYQWFHGTMSPTYQSIPNIHKIEDFSGLRRGALITRLSHLRFKTRPFRTGLGSFGRKVRENQELIYELKELPKRVEQEFAHLVSIMTLPYESEDIKKNSYWRTNEDGKVPTAQIKERYMRGFFGFLLLPPNHENIKQRGLSPNHPNPKLRGKGLKPDQLTLALFGDKKLVEAYIEFKKIRAGGVYTNETENFLRFCTSLLREKSGFLAQQPKYGRRLPAPVAKKDWAAWCENARARFLTVRRDLKANNQIKQGRVVDEPIEFIIKTKHPMRFLRHLINNIEQNAPPSTRVKVMKALYFRNRLFIRMLCANPLRLKHYQRMTWNKDNTGNLYQDDDGKWRLRYRASDFKNERGAAKKAYDVPIAQSLWKDIEEYLFKHRPELQGADECDYVFRPAAKFRSSRHVTKPTDMLPINYMSRIIRQLTQQYLDCDGFGPHAFRHIIATDYIKNHPEGFEVAARVLHITVNTVRRDYAHIKTADYIEYWNVYHDKVMGGDQD
jgi:integrase/transcriptional regulator with XRE-family HTH domain